MGRKVGLWIDHKQAIIVSIIDKKEEMGVILSNVQKQPRRAGDSPLRGPYEALQQQDSDTRQRTFTGQLNVYYDSVIASIRDAESILIFGPGEAKTELNDRLEKNKLDERIAGIETTDKMTDRQIIVRNYFIK
jgi:hypothetical protein